MKTGAVIASHTYLPIWRTVKKGGFLGENGVPMTKLIGAENAKPNGFCTSKDTSLSYKFLFPQKSFLAKASDQANQKFCAVD